MRTSLVVFALANAACVTKVDPFHCESSGQCAGGTCEAAGFCSQVDTGCPSGRRYVAEAGDLAGRCVGDEPADAPAGTDGGAIDGAGPGVCGDMTVNDGEDCDDGNTDDDDGCVSCAFARCGDGHVRAGAEECDDNNTADDDGCTSACLSCTGGADTLGAAGHCYVRFDTATDATAAMNACVGLGGHLAVYTTSAESMTVGAWLPAGQFWIGLNDSGSEGTFTWGNFEALGETQWASGQPQNQVNRDCVYQEGPTGDWTVESCGQSLGYVCERDPWVVDPATNHAYQLIALERNPAMWANAHTFCTDKGTQLASVTSAAEQTFLTGLVKGTSWLGGQDMSTEGTFVWSTGEPFNDYTNWDTGQPDDGPGGGGADCVAMQPGGKWQDDPCSGSAGFICEVE